MSCWVTRYWSAVRRPKRWRFSAFLDEAETANSTGWLLRENPIIIPLLRHAHERKMRRAYVEHVLGLLGAPIDAVEASGGEALSGRELEVLRILAEGLGNREIAERIFVSEATVKTVSVNLKLDARTRTKLSRGPEPMRCDVRDVSEISGSHPKRLRLRGRPSASVNHHYRKTSRPSRPRIQKLTGVPSSR